MRREVSASIFAVLIVAAAILTVYYLNVGPTGFAIVGESGTSFNGTFENTFYNETISAVVLTNSSNPGTYTSKVFDAGSSATWNNLTSQGNGSVTFEIRVCSTANCSDSNFTTGNLNNLNFTGRYFQYRASFDVSDDVLGSVTVDYTVAQQQQGTPPTVSISAPAGQDYTSLSAIPLTFTITGATGTNLTCLYNIVSSISVNNKPNTIVDGCANGVNTKTFDLSKDGGDNTLTVYVSDSSGNASASSGFSVSVPSGGITGGAVEEEEEDETPPVAAAPAISLVAEVPSQTINQGNSRGLSLLVQNTGKAFATSCVLTGDDSGFLAVDGSARDIADGNEVAFPFSVNVPNDAGVGQRTLSLSVNCANGVTVSQTLVVDVLQKGLDLNITNVQRTRDDRVRVDYSLIELTGEDQDVEILFIITDASGLEVANASQNSSVDANSTDDFRVNIPINETLQGNLTLSAAFNSQVYSSSVLEPISLGPVTGGAIFGEGGAGSIIVLIVVVLVLGAVFFVVRRMRTSKQ